MKKIVFILSLFLGLRLLAADFNDYFKNSFEDSDQAFTQALETIKKIQPKAEMHKPNAIPFLYPILFKISLIFYFLL